jgi:hypothetical protein
VVHSRRLTATCLVTLAHSWAGLEQLPRMGSRRPTLPTTSRAKFLITTRAYLLLVLSSKLTSHIAGRHLPLSKNVFLHPVSTLRAVPADGPRFTVSSGSASLSRTRATSCSTKTLKAWPLRVPLYPAMLQTTLASNLRSNGWSC